MGVIIFNGVSSEIYGIQVERPPNYETPERDYDVIHVPGRNGDVVIDQGSYKNVNRAYNIAFGSERKNFTLMAPSVSRWLNSVSGYAVLEDTYEPDYYRLGMYRESRSIENILGHAGRATITFDCKPQRFLKSGDKKITITKLTTIVNPTPFPALPIITVYGSGNGVLEVNGYTIFISSFSDSITINSDIGDAYKGYINCNSDIVLSRDFPVLTEGENEISFADGITSVEVIPKWWIL